MQINPSDVVLETQVLVSILNFLSLGLGTLRLSLVHGLGAPSLGLGLVLVPVSLGKFTNSSIVEQSRKE